MNCKRIFNIIFFILLPALIFSQNDTLIKELESDYYNDKKDSLINIFGYKKIFIPEYELPAITALSYYPELDSTLIEIKSKKLKRLGNARPKMDFLFRKQMNRHYIIIINKNAEDVLGLPFSDIPFNAQTGFFGHELAHITDYTEKNNLKLIFFIAKYLFMQKSIERHTDKITIKHNLGSQLYELRSFIINNPDTNEDYLKFKKDNYLNCEEILYEISKLNNSLPVNLNQH
jgi:hypothetical protein